MRRQPEPEAMDVGAEADAYAQADFAEVNAAFVERLIDYVGMRDGLLCLDLGTGPGDIPIRVIRYGVRWHVVAGDVSAPMLKHAARAVHAAGLGWAIRLTRMDGKAAPFPARTFEVVFSNSILHHVEDPDRFWREVKRVAKPGAKALLRDLARPETPEEAAAIVRRYSAAESALLQEEFYRSLLAAFTPDEVRAQLARAGLGSLHVEMVSDRHLDVFGTIP
jgi:ubiquinone/menaquinone biosynthesis C-methylase UbiE